MSKKNLTKKQEAFCQAHVKNGSGKSILTFKEAGYSYKNKKDTTIYQEVNFMLKNPRIALRIKELQAKVSEIAEKEFKITHFEILQHLDILRKARIDEYLNIVNGKLVFKDFASLTANQLMCIEGIKQDRNGNIEIKLHGKEWSIDKINKHIGFYGADNSQKAPVVIANDEEREARIAALIAKATNKPTNL